MSSSEASTTKEKPFNMLTFGNINLTLILTLDQKDVSEYNIDKQILEDLNDLSFLENNSKLWNKIDVISCDESLNALVTMNKMKKGKNMAMYVVFKKIEYNDTNFDFSPILESVLSEYGIKIKPYDLGQSEINIQFQLEYEGKKNVIGICGEIKNEEEQDDSNNEKNEEEKNDSNNEKNEEEKNDSNNEKNEEEKNNDNNNNQNEDINKNENNKNSQNKNNNNKEEESEEEEEEENDEDKDDIGNLSEILSEENIEQFKYIYVNIPDIISGTFGDVTFKQLYNFLYKLKDETNLEIILYLGNKFDKSKDLYKLLKVSDIHIISNKNSLLEVLKKTKAKEEKKKKKKSNKSEKTDTQKKSEEEDENEKVVENNSGDNEDKLISKRLEKRPSNTKNESLNSSFRKLAPLDQFSNKPLNKKNMFNYLRKIIYSKNKTEHPNYNNKLGIYFDDFNKIIFVNYNKNNYQASVNDYDLNIFPKHNVHKLKEIDKMKEILKNYQSQSISILLSGTLNQILNNKEGINNSDYYLISLAGSFIIKKILLFEMNNVAPPMNKSFYSVKIKKSDLKDYFDKLESEKKENGFNVEFPLQDFRINKSVMYTPLKDKYLRSYMQSSTNIDVLKSNDFISTRKKILTEQSLSPKEIRNIKKDKAFLDFMNSRGLNDNTQDYMKEFLKKKKETKYYIPGVDGIKEYYLYLGKRCLNKNYLPTIKKKTVKINLKDKKLNTIQKENPNRVEKSNDNENINDNDYGVSSGDGTEKNSSDYKEIEFQETPSK